MEEHILLGWVLLGGITGIACILIGLVMYGLKEFWMWTREQRGEWGSCDAWSRRMEGKINRILGKWDRYEVNNVDGQWLERGAAVGGRHRVRFGERVEIREIDEHAL